MHSYLSGVTVSGSCHSREAYRCLHIDRTLYLYRRPGACVRLRLRTSVLTRDLRDIRLLDRPALPGELPAWLHRHDLSYRMGALLD